MQFNIGDKVIETASNTIGTITDKMYSEAKELYVFVIKPEDGGRSIMRDEDEVEAWNDDVTYVTETQILPNVVVGIIYEVRGDKRTEVSRGHGHIIHQGAVGIAQAVSYAFKKAFLALTDGDYLLPNHNN